MVLARLAEEHQVTVRWAQRIFQGQPEGFSGELGQWHCACAVVFGIGKARNALFQIDLVAKQPGDF